MVTYTKEELEAIDGIYKALAPNLSLKAKDPNVFRKISREIVKLNEKNSDALLTNIIGRQLLINQKNEDDILEILGIKKEEVKRLIKESPYFDLTFNDLKLTDQLVFAIPLIIYSSELHKLKKEEEAQLVFLLTFYKPYASRISYHFKYGVNEKQMLYTVEHLTERFDIKKYGDIFSVLTKKSAGSYKNYIEDTDKNKIFSDKELYVIYSSGVATSVNAMIGKIVEQYIANKGKQLEYDLAYQTTLDKDADSTDIEDADIESDSAVKARIVSKVATRVNKDPIDRMMIRVASQSEFGSSSKYYQDILTTAVSEITEKMGDQLPDFFSSIVGAFLFNINPTTGGRYTAADFRTPVFVKGAMDLFRKKNLKDVNLLKVKDYIAKMLENCSLEYNMNFGATKQREFRNALYFYWVLMIKNNQ